MSARGVVLLGCGVSLFATVGCGTNSDNGRFLPAVDGGDDAAVDAGANTEGDGGPLSDAQTNPDPDGGPMLGDGQVVETVSAELTSPTEGAQFYQHEQVSLSGTCLGSGQATSRIELERTDGSIESLAGHDLKHTFAALGVHKVRLVCETSSGARAVSEHSIELFRTPSLIFTSELPTRGSRQHLFSTRMDQPGVVQRLDPTGAAFANLSDLKYLNSDHLILRGDPIGDRYTAHRLTACRGDGECTPPAYEALPVFKEDCSEYLVGQAPDGQSVLMRYYCDVPDIFADEQSLVWVDLRGSEPTLHKVGGNLDATFTPDSQFLIVSSRELGTLSYFDVNDPLGGLAPGFEHVAAYQFSPDKSRLWVAASNALYSVDLTLQIDLAFAEAAELAIAGEPTSITLGAGTAAFGVLNLVYAPGTDQFVSRALAWDLTREVTYSGAAAFRQFACGSKLILDPADGPPKVLDFSASGVPPVLVLAGGVQELNTGLVSFDANCTRMLHQTSWYYESQLVDLQTGEALVMPRSQFVAGGQYLLRENLDADYGLALHAIDGLEVEATPVVAFLDPLEYVTDVRESPDGQELLFVGDLQRKGDFALYRMSYADLTPKVVAEHLARQTLGYSRSNYWQFSPDGSRLAIMSAPGRDFSTGALAINAVREFDWSTGDLLWTSALPSGDKSEVYYADRIPGSNRVLMRAWTDASQRHDLYSVGPRGESLVKHTEGKPGSLVDYTLSSDGTRIAIGTTAGIFIEPMRSDSSPVTPLASKTFSTPFHAENALLISSLTEKGIIYSHDWNGLSWLDIASGQSQVILASDTFPVLSTTSYVQLGENFGHVSRLLLEPDEPAVHQSVPIEVDQGVPVGVKLDEAVDRTLPLTADGRFLLDPTDTGTMVTDFETGGSSELPYTEVTGQYRDGLLLQTYPVVRLFDLRVPELVGSWDFGDAYNYRHTDDLRVVVMAIRDEAANFTLKVIDTKTNQVRTLVEPGGPDEPSGDYLTLSPTGKWLLYQDASDQLKIVATDGSSAPRFLSRYEAWYLYFDRLERFLFGIEDKGYYESDPGTALWNLEDLSRVNQIIPAEYEDHAGVYGWFE